MVRLQTYNPHKHLDPVQLLGGHTIFFRACIDPMTHNRAVDYSSNTPNLSSILHPDVIIQANVHASWTYPTPMVSYGYKNNTRVHYKYYNKKMGG